jgi:Domain of unknown function (DUF427)
VLNGHVVLDTTSALYVWEWEHYPDYYIPVADIDPAVLVDEQHEQKLSRGTARRYGLAVSEVSRPAALRVYDGDARFGLEGRGVLSGTRWTPGTRRTNRSSFTPATLTPASMPSAPPGGCASNSTGPSWPSPHPRSWCSRPACPPATTSTAARSTYPPDPLLNRHRLPLQRHHQRLLGSSRKWHDSS